VPTKRRLKNTIPFETEIKASDTPKGSKIKNRKQNLKTEIMKTILFNIENTTKELNPIMKAAIYAVLIFILICAMSVAIGVIRNLENIQFSY
jgi:hypothetical protein